MESVLLRRYSPAVNIALYRQSVDATRNFPLGGRAH